MAIYPTAEQFQELMQGPADQPVVMVNLLRFKATADTGGRTGEEAYRTYVDAMRAVVEGEGGRILWAGRVDSVVIGDGAARFDMIGLVEYPSRQKFLEIAMSDRVRAIGGDRAEGLESQWLLATTAEPM